MDDQLQPGGPFVRHVQARQSHHSHQKRCADGGTEQSGSSTRWSFGRCSVRGLATLLKRGQGKQHQKQHQQLSCLSNDLNLGNHSKGKTSSEKASELKPKIRTTVLGRSVPPPPPPPAVKLPASPLYQMRRKIPRSQHHQHLQQQPQEYHQPLECIPDDEFDKPATLRRDSNSPMSLLLELDGELRRVALIGWQRSLRCLSDVWSLFASQWPTVVPAIGPNWRVSFLPDGKRGWVALKEDQIDGLSALVNGSRLKLERTSSCSCSCTCQNSCCGSSSASSSSATSFSCSSQQQRIDRLEAQVTSLTRRLGVPERPNCPVDTIDDEGAVGVGVKCSAVQQSLHQGEQNRVQRLQDIRDECRRLRDTRDAIRQDHERRVRETRQMLSDLACDVRRILSGAATIEATVESSECSQRRLVDAELRAYQSERAEVSALIDDIDETTGELRHDVLRRRCRSNPAEVELLALHLSRATQRLASLKNRFPGIQNRTRELLRQETQTIAADERILGEEEAKLEAWLRKVKKLTMMLYTFKQLADAQAKETPNLVPISVPEYSTEAADEVRRDLLQGVLSVCPDHERRARAIELAEVGIERRRRMLREAATLKAEKTLTAAAGRLKSVKAATGSNPESFGQKSKD